MPNSSLVTSSEDNVQEIYKTLVEKLDSLKGINFEEKKTSIHVVTTQSAFLGIHPKKKFLDLNIVTDQPLDSKRIKKVEQVSARRFHNEVRLENPSQVDAELWQWITQAYQLKSQK